MEKWMDFRLHGYYHAEGVSVAFVQNIVSLHKFCNYLQLVTTAGLLLWKGAQQTARDTIIPKFLNL